jgi:heme/copper-type cytochrome/quinol oxidase subunit 2
MAFWEKYYAKMLLLPFFAIIIFLVLFIRSFFKSKDNRRSSESSRDLFSKAQAQHYERLQHISVWTRLVDTKKIIVPILFSSAVTLYTFLVSNSLSPFNCVSSYNDSLQKNIYYMARNPSKPCYDNEWYFHLNFVIIFSVTYGLLFPLMVAVMFYRQRKKIDEHDFQFGYGALVSLYTRTFFFWELVSMMKRASFVIMTEFLSTRQDAYLTKFAASISTIAFFSGLEVIFNPYATKNLNLLSSTYVQRFNRFLIFWS